MEHPCVFLLGLHGCGKSSIGRALQNEHGWQHLSIGDLARLARKRRLPQSVPIRLMVMLAGHQVGHPFRHELVLALLSHIKELRSRSPVVIDGFPVEASQVRLCPRPFTAIHVTLDDESRVARLQARAQETKRAWTPGLPSARDEALPSVLSELQGMSLLAQVTNSTTLANSVADVLKLVATQFQA